MIMDHLGLTDFPFTVHTLVCVIARTAHTLDFPDCHLESVDHMVEEGLAIGYFVHPCAKSL